MQSAYVDVSESEWRQFKAKCARNGTNITARLAEFVREDIKEA